MVRQFGLFVVALGCIVFGVSMLSVPAAWITGGLIVGVFSLRYDFQPIRKGRK